MPTLPIPPTATPASLEPPLRKGGRDVWTTVALGYAPPLAVLGGVAAVAIGAARADPAALLWTVAATAAAALATIAAASRTLGALRRAESAIAPADPRCDAKAADACARKTHIEIDHKVRNTLQVVASLLSLELRRAGPSGERSALLRVQARLHSLSLVHGRSSAAEAPTVVRLDLIAAEIAEHLFAGGSPESEAVVLRTALDRVSATPERAVAFALFVNEALMTARDYCARAQTPGSVALTLDAVGHGGWLLTVGNFAGATVEGDSADDEAQSALLMASCATQLGATLTARRFGDFFEVRLAMPPMPRS